MTPGSLSPLQLDPLGGLTARLITMSCIIIAVTVALLLSVTHWDQVASPVLQVAALLTIAAAAVVMITGTNPYRAPVSRFRMAVIWSTMGVATLLDSLSQWGANTSLRDDWGPLAFAIIVLMTGSYRPARQILRMTVGATLFLVVLAIVQIAPIYEDNPARFIATPFVFATPVLATGIAAAAFSRTLVVHLLAWRTSAISAQRDAVQDLRSGLVPSVREHRLELLNAEVVPFLQRVVDSGELTAEDSDRARELAGGLRAVMLPEFARNWLESSVDEVVDPEHLAERMGNEHRGSLKALLAALQNPEPVVEGSVVARLRSQETTAFLRITATVLDVAVAKSELAPYFAVARSFFPDAVLEIERGELLCELHFALG